MEWEGKRFWHAPRDSMHFKSYKLSIFRLCRLIFLDHSWLQVTETGKARSQIRGGGNYCTSHPSGNPQEALGVRRLFWSWFYQYLHTCDLGNDIHPHFLGGRFDAWGVEWFFPHHFWGPNEIVWVKLCPSYDRSQFEQFLLSFHELL